MGPAQLPAPPARRAQLLDNINDVPYAERINIIAASWRAATNPLASGALLHNLHRVTLMCLLDNEWSRLEKPLRDEVTEGIEICADAIKKENAESLDEKRLRYLLRTAEDPWHHPVLKDIMRGKQPLSQDVLLWLREEGCTGALERLRQLCAAKGAGEGAALRLVDALVPLPPLPQTLPPNFRCRALDSLMVLLMRANRTTDCIAHIKAMDSRVAYALIGRLASRNKSHGRIWKHAQDTALLCTQVLVATCLVRPIDTQLGALAAKLASLYASRSEELAPALRKLLHSADTAAHIYIVCKAVQHQFGDTMRPFICELYIRALTTGVNELERQKHLDETGTNTSHQLADWFLSLADLLSPNPIVSAECVLTAFSLHPSKHYYGRVKECSALIKQKSEPEISENSNLNDEKFDLAIDGLQSSLNQMQMLKDTSGTLSNSVQTEADKKTVGNVTMGETVPQSLVSGAVIEGEGLELSSDLCHDLVVLLSGPRLKMLTWDLSWEKLSEYCLSYMADTEEGTKTVTTELKYVHLDYSQYTIKEPEIHDIYFGIEKGYEHHLEIEEDWTEVVDTKPIYKEEPIGEDFDNSETDSGDCIYYDEGGHKRTCKKSKKKVVKKPSNPDADSKSTVKPADKVKVKRERKPKEKSEKSSNPRPKKVNPVLPIENYNKPYLPSAYYGNSTDEMNRYNLHHQNNSKPPITSIYRMQMEMHEAHRKKVEHMMFGDYITAKTEDAPVDNSVRPPMQHVNSMYQNYSTHSEMRSSPNNVNNLEPYRGSDNRHISQMNYSMQGNMANIGSIHPNTSNSNTKKSKSSLLSFRKQSAIPNLSGYLNQDATANLPHEGSQLKSEYYDREQSNKVRQYQTYSRSPSKSVNKSNYISSLLANSSINSTNHKNLYITPHLPQTETNVNANDSYKSNFQESEKKSTLNELSLLRNKLLILTGKHNSNETSHDNTFSYWPAQSPPPRASSVLKFNPSNAPYETYDAKHSLYRKNNINEVLNYSNDQKYKNTDSKIKYNSNYYQKDAKNLALFIDEPSRVAYEKYLNNSNVVKTVVKQEYSMSYDADMKETQINKTCIDPQELLNEITKQNVYKINRKSPKKYLNPRQLLKQTDPKLDVASSSNEPLPREYNKFKSKVPPPNTVRHQPTSSNQGEISKDKLIKVKNNNNLLRALLFGDSNNQTSVDKNHTHQQKIPYDDKPVNKEVESYSIAKSPKTLSEMMDNALQKIYKLAQNNQHNIENTSDVNPEAIVKTEQTKAITYYSAQNDSEPISTDILEPKIPDLYEKQESIAKTKINQQSDAIYQKFLAEVQSTIESNISIEATSSVDNQNLIDNITLETMCSSQASNLFGDAVIKDENKNEVNEYSNFSTDENIESSFSRVGISPQEPILYDENAQTETIRPENYATFEMDFVASNVEIKSASLCNINSPALNDNRVDSKNTEELSSMEQHGKTAILPSDSNVITEEIIESILIDTFPNINKKSSKIDKNMLPETSTKNESIDNTSTDAKFIENEFAALSTNDIPVDKPIVNDFPEPSLDITREFIDNVLPELTNIAADNVIDETAKPDSSADIEKEFVEKAVTESSACTTDEAILNTLTNPSVMTDLQQTECKSEPVETVEECVKKTEEECANTTKDSANVPKVIVYKKRKPRRHYKVGIVKNLRSNKARVASNRNLKTKPCKKLKTKPCKNLKTKPSPDLIDSNVNLPVKDVTNLCNDSITKASTDKPLVQETVSKNFQKKELVIKIHRLDIGNVQLLAKNYKDIINNPKTTIENTFFFTEKGSIKTNVDPITADDSEVLKTSSDVILETDDTQIDDDMKTQYTSSSGYSPSSLNFSDSNTVGSDCAIDKVTESESQSCNTKLSENIIEIKSEKSATSDDNQPISSLIDKNKKKTKSVKKIKSINNKNKSNRLSSLKEKADIDLNNSSDANNIITSLTNDVISIIDDSSEESENNEMISSTTEACILPNKAQENDVIDLLSDSDVEIVVSNDPIAVDPVGLTSQETDQSSCMINENSSPILPLFFTVVPDIRIVRNNKLGRPRGGGRKRRGWHSASKVSESLIIYNKDSSKIIKLSKMPKSDCEKFQKSCIVKLRRDNLAEIKNTLFKPQLKKTKIGKAKKLTMKKKKPSVSTVKTRSASLCDSLDNSMPFTEIATSTIDKILSDSSQDGLEIISNEPTANKITIDLSSDNNDEDNFNLIKVKEENIDKTIDPTQSDHDKIFDLEKNSDVNKSDAKNDVNLVVNKNHEITDTTSVTVDILNADNCGKDILNNTADEEIVTLTNTDDDNNKSVNIESCIDFELEIDGLKSSEEYSKNLKKSLVSKKKNPKSSNKSNSSKGLIIKIIDDEPQIFNRLDLVPSEIYSECLETSPDFISSDNLLSDSMKTYKKPLYQNKRKFKFDSECSMKKVCNGSKIDLPKLSKDDSLDCCQVKIEEEIMYDRVQLMSIKQLLLMENDETIDIFDDDLDVNLFDTVQTMNDEADVSPDIDTDFIKNLEDNRDSIYSPIFSDELYTFDDKTFSTENVDSNNHISQGKGFGDWSGRGNKKDSSRGSTESPAAVLSDAVTTRPPLALHNFTNSKTNDSVTQMIENLRRACCNHNDEYPIDPEVENELNNILLIKKMSKNNSKSFLNCNNENITDLVENLNTIKSLLNTPKSFSKYIDMKKNGKVPKKINPFDKIELSDKSLLSRVPGLNDLEFIKPSQNNAIVQVVQLGQLPVSSAQQNSLSDTATRSQASSEFLNLTNSVDRRSPQNEISVQSADIDNNVSDFSENATDNIKTHVTDGDAENKPSDNASSDDVLPENLSNDVSFENMPTNANSELNTSSTPQGTNSEQIALDKPIHLDLTQSTSEENFADSVNNEQKDVSNNAGIENHIGIIPTSTHNFISANRGQALVNLLSQKIIHSPGGGQHLQMATFPKGATINALSLQQALAQILPPPLSQSSGESVIHSAGHSQVGTSQVVHIVQGKNTTQTSTGTFGNLLVDNNQSSVINNAGTTQVLHIVQGKHTNSNSSGVLNQSQFSGLSLVETGQQSGNQVLHIVNTGVQNKNNTTAQVLKRVNLLTSITNSQGNNEQKMVQFVCKAPDGKSIQLNTQPQRGMVLRLQPIENSTFTAQKTSETTTSIANTSVQSAVIKPTIDQSQQELKSRSVYEENYAKFIQNSSQVVPSSPEKSVSLPKFNQAFGKSVYQDNNSIAKTNENLEVAQNSNEQHTSQDLTTLNLGQLGHISNPPLLIRKAPQSNILHQNVMQQVKQSIAPMNIQTIHGGVIYTRQIPVNIGGGQTINLITVPSSDIIDEVQLQSIQKQNQEKATAGEQLEPQVIKLVSQDQQQANNSICHIDAASDDTNQSFAEQVQNSVNNHPLLTQMRIKVPMLSKGGGQVVTGARVVRPVLQIQRNLIPGTNPAVYQQLVLTTAPSVRQSVPTTTTTIRPTRPPTTHQESNLSSSTLEQLREFDMVLEQVKERSTVQPGNNSNSNFSDTSPQCQTTENSELDSPQPSVQSSTQREVLYSIGPNQTVNVTYVNQKVIAKTSTTLTTSYGSSESIVNLSQNSPSTQITHGLTNVVTHSKPCPNPSKVSSKSIKSKPSKPSNPSNSSASKSTPVAAKTSLQKPLEDEQTTQRILYILAEYKEQVENSPDKDKPAPRRRSNPPTNPTTSSKRKKGSGGSSKKSGSGQSLQEMSPLGDDAGHTMGSEDSSCGLSQGECTDNSIQGTENQSPQSSPQKSAKKILFQQEAESPAPIVQQQQRNVLIADGQAITMSRPGTGKATAVLMPANYLLPMSMVKGSQQITIVTNQGPKILSVPQGEGGTTNALFLQRLIGPAGLKPMLARPGQVRHVRLPASTVQNLQAFNLNSSNIVTSENSWVGNSSVSNSQPKLLVEYNPSNSEINPDSNTDTNSESIKDGSSSVNSDNLHSIKIENSIETSSDVTGNSSCLSENILLDQAQNSIHDTNIQSDLPTFQTHIPKTSGSNTLNLIQVHSLNPECGKLYSVQNSSGITSLIQLSGKSTLSQHQENINRLNEENADGSMDIQDSAVSQFETHYLNTKKVIISHDNKLELSKEVNINTQIDSSMPIVDGMVQNQQTFILSHGVQKSDGDALNSNQRDDNHSWSGNDSVATSHGNGPSPSFVNFENSPQTISQREEQHNIDGHESVGMRDLAVEGTRVLRHPYSPSNSPSGPRHLYHKMFITTPIKKSFNADLVEHSTSSTEEDKQYIQRPLKKKNKDTPSTQKVTFHNNSTTFTIHHHQNPQVVSICHPDRKSCAAESMDVNSDVSVGRGNINQSGVATHHSVASLRHKYAVMEHELRLQKSLSEECEDLGVDSPSASDLFPEAELLFAASPSSQFDQSQDGCALASGSHISTPNTHISHGSSHQLSTSSSLSSNIKDSRLSDIQSIEPGEESEFARMHPNTTFHSGEIELVGDDPEDAAVNMTFRGSSIKHTHPVILSKRGDVVRSVIEGIGNSGSGTLFPPTKITPHFSMVDLPRRTLNAMSAIQSSDDYSEGADDSMNSAESKDCLVNNKSLDGILSNDIVKRDLSLASTESPITISSNIIQRNITQVIRHASSDQLSLPSTDDAEKLHNSNLSELGQNGNFLLDGSNDARPTGDSSILKSIMLERDGRDALTCSSPEQHSELFWESNSNSNQSEEQMPPAPPNLLDFSSEDSNKCCKSPLSCEETNSTDSSSMGGLNTQSLNSHPLRINSVIKSSGSNSGAAEGPILHSALLSNNPNIISQDISKKMPITLNSVHKSDSNTSSSPDGGNRTSMRKSWNRGIKGSGRRRILSPQSLSTEINMGAEIETSSSEGVSIFTKPSGGSVLHSGSSTPEEGSGNHRRVSLRGPGGVKRSCHCCGGAPTAVTPASTSSSSRRVRRKPASLH